MKCSNCGKNFDYDKYYGICPKCGTFQRPETKEPEVSVDFQTQKDPSLYTYIDDAEDNAYREPESGNVPDRKKKKRSWVYMLACVCICLTCLLGIVITVAVQESVLKEEARLNQELEVKTCEPGVSFSLGVHEIEVGDARVLENADVRPEFPSGEKCVAVSVRKNGMDKEWDYKNRAEFPYVYYKDAKGRVIYKEALGAYSGIEQYQEYYGFQMFDSYVYQYEADCEGEFVFFVDAAASELTICFEERQREENKMEQLVKVFEATLPIIEEAVE